MDLFEQTLWVALRATDAKAEDGLRMQVEHLEGLSSDDSQWPHMEDRLTQLREFYSSL